MATEKPNEDDLRAFAKRADEGPVTMLNLLAFKPDGGWESYARYAREVQPMLEARQAKATHIAQGAELIIGGDADRWDVVLLVQYPSRAAFLDMITSEEYQAIQHFRSEALERSVLLATDPIEMG